MKEECPFLFVYGSLRPNSGCKMENYLSSRAESQGIYYFPGQLLKVSWYPGAVLPKKPGQWVVGNLFRLFNPKESLQELDDYEGDEFERRCLDVFHSKSKKTSQKQTWIYLLKRPAKEFRSISSGDFLKSP